MCGLACGLSNFTEDEQTSSVSQSQQIV